MVIRRLRLWLRFQPIGLIGRWVEAYGSESRLRRLDPFIGSKLKAESSKRSTDYKNYPQITQIKLKLKAEGKNS
jgi:hypothetical protein